MSLFEKASRQQLRFQSARGTLSVEDLWTLGKNAAGLSELDSMAKALNKSVRAAAEEESFIPGSTNAKATAEAEKTALAFEIVKHVITTLVAERDAKNQAQAKAEQKQKLLALLNERDAEDLKGKSRAELEAMIAAL